MNANARELAADFDLEKLTPQFYADPYPTYRALREHEPVKRMPNGSWFLTRYDDLVSAYKNTVGFLLRAGEGIVPNTGPSHCTSVIPPTYVFDDPPAHTRVRELVAGALSPTPSLASTEPLVALVDPLLDPIAAKGHFELIFHSSRSRSR